AVSQSRGTVRSPTAPHAPGTPDPRGLDLNPELLAEAGARVHTAIGSHAAGQAVDRLLRNTAQTTVRLTGEDTFVITGDIPAMWLRDSSAQLAPLLRLGALDPSLVDVV